MILKKKVPYEVVIVVCAALATVMWFLPNGATASAHRLPGWLIDSAKLRLSLKQDASAGAFYERTASGPLAFATIVAEMRAAWPAENATLVHQSALQVAADLLHRRDVEVGEVVGGAFNRSQLPPWAMSEKIRSDVLASPGFFRDADRYVFRRK